MQDGFMAHIDTQNMYNMRRGLTQEEGVKGKIIYVRGVVWFRPWIRIMSLIFSFLVIPDPDLHPVKSGITTPLIYVTWKYWIQCLLFQIESDYTRSGINPNDLWRRSRLAARHEHILDSLAVGDEKAASSIHFQLQPKLGTWIHTVCWKPLLRLKTVPELLLLQSTHWSMRLRAGKNDGSFSW